MKSERVYPMKGGAKGLGWGVWVWGKLALQIDSWALSTYRQRCDNTHVCRALCVWRVRQQSTCWRATCLKERGKKAFPFLVSTLSLFGVGEQIKCIYFSFKLATRTFIYCTSWPWWQYPPNDRWIVFVDPDWCVIFSRENQDNVS